MMQTRLLLTIAIILLNSCLSTSANGAREPSVKNLFPRLIEGQGQIWSAPFKKDTWSSSSTFFMLTLSGLSFSLDGEPSRELREGGDFRCLNNVLDSKTADLSLVILPLSLATIGELSGSVALKSYGWKISESAIDAYVTSLVIKTASMRARPHTGNTYGFWDGGNSFPSGHATVAWSMAATTAKHFSQQKWVPWIVYPLAGLVSFSRVTTGNHFVSDAVTGSVLGFVIGKYVVD